MVAVDTRDTNPDGGGMIAPGTYLFAVNDVTTGEDSIAVECVVVAGDPTDAKEGPQAGRKQTEYLKIFGKGASRLLQWACCVGLITKDEWKAAKEQNASVEFEEVEAVGRYFVGGIESKPYQGNNEEHKGKHFPALDFRIWAIDDPKAIDVLKTPEAREAIGPAIVDGILKQVAAKAPPAAPPATPPATPPAPKEKQVAAPVAAAASDDPFGDC
jgi:hypothetical protein